MRMEDTDQVEAGRARFLVGFEQVFRTQLIASALSACVGVLQRLGASDMLGAVVDISNHGPAALVRKFGLGVRDHGLPRLRTDLNHSKTTRSDIWWRRRTAW